MLGKICAKDQEQKTRRQVYVKREKEASPFNHSKECRGVRGGVDKTRKVGLQLNWGGSYMLF